ncbi:MAG: bifunctional nuclease domain-containing protein [Spirochaetota bacterium]
MIPVKFSQLLFSNVGFIVLLKEESSERVLPIFIGAAEAQAIAIKVNNVEVPRPLTHDLLKNILDFMECRLVRIEVCDLREGTFYARLILDRDGIELEMDSRPSDAIALALRTSSPIFVSEKVMDEAGRFSSEAEKEAEQQKPEQKQTRNPQQEEKLSPLESLKRDLDKAVEEERYEDAARLHKEIKRIEDKHTEN